jgi:hypothetical protein
MAMVGAIVCERMASSCELECNEVYRVVVVRITYCISEVHRLT